MKKFFLYIYLYVYFFSDMITYNDAPDYWNTPSGEDPLKLPDGSQDDGNILSNFLNNNDQAKAFGISSTENEFISLDSLNDRNRTALVSHYRLNPALEWHLYIIFCVVYTRSVQDSARKRLVSRVWGIIPYENWENISSQRR